MDKDSKFTRDEEGYIAVRVVSGTEALPAVDKDYMFARDTDGNIAVRVVNGAGSGGGGDTHNLGYYETPEALRTAHPTANPGDFAIVNSTDTVWIWDADTSAWKDGDTKGQVTSVNNQTGAVSLDINDVAPTQTDKSGYVLGTDGFVAGWVKPEIVQRSTMPQASEDELGNVYQFVGSTDATYTNGYFYKCVSDGAVTPTYSWTSVQVQASSGGLPSQAGNAGKLLTTDGTDASWGQIVDSGFTVKNSTTNQTITINSIDNGSQYIGFMPQKNDLTFWAGLYVNSDGVTTNFYPRVKSGNRTLGRSNEIIDVIYVGKIVSDWHNYEITVPKIAGEMAVKSVNTTITLAAADWSSNSQTVTVNGITTTGVVFVSPDPADQSAYTGAGIICTAQAANSLTFTCTSVPSGDIVVNVVQL